MRNAYRNPGETDHAVVGCSAIALAASLACAASAQNELEFMGADEPAAETADLVEGVDEGVSVSSFLTVDLHVQDTDLVKVLQMLSIQSQKSIIASKNVSATVTADLYDVTFYEALDAILNVNGYGYVEKGDFIYVYTQDELAQIQEAQRQMVHEVFTLAYLNATDAAVFVTPLLSESGSVAINGEAEPGILPDENNNGENSWAYTETLVVRDYPENVREIGTLLERLDTRPQQVMVEAAVLQTQLTENNAWGVDWSIVADLDFENLSSPLSPVDDLIDGDDGFIPADNEATGFQQTVGQTGGPGGFKIGVVSDDISVFLRVLDEVTDTTVLSRPKALALNRQRAEILIGRRIGYLSTTATETSTTQTVQFLDTGTQLIYRPFVGRDGFIRMELKPSVSEGLIREVTGANGDTVTIPDQITQELTTNVIVRDGQTIVLGGLFKEETTLGRRQVPVLGDIPLLGAAFQGRDDETRRSEIMFLITPTLMPDELMFADGRKAQEYMENARMGAREGVLWWSNDRMTAQHNMRAQEYLRQGDTEMALWEINRSLSLNPVQPLVIRMRERITGEDMSWFNHSFLYELTRSRIESSNELGAATTSRPSPTVTGLFEAAGAKPRAVATATAGPNLAWLFVSPDEVSTVLPEFAATSFGGATAVVDTVGSPAMPDPTLPDLQLDWSNGWQAFVEMGWPLETEVGATEAEETVVTVDPAIEDAEDFK